MEDKPISKIMKCNLKLFNDEGDSSQDVRVVFLFGISLAKILQKLCSAHRQTSSYRGDSGTCNTWIHLGYYHKSVMWPLFSYMEVESAAITTALPCPVRRTVAPGGRHVGRPSLHSSLKVQL